MQTTDLFRAASKAPAAVRRRAVPPKNRTAASRDIERLVEEARRLVPMFARRYQGRGVAFEDLVGAGNLGVVEAAYRFDPERGVKFGSYAAWWIRKAIAQTLGTAGSVVQVPRFSFERRRRVMDAVTRGRPSGERDLGLDEVAAGLGLSTRQAEQALAFSMGAVSLDTPETGESTRNWGERLARPAEEGPEAIVMDADRTRRAREAMRALSNRQRVVIMLRYGMSDRHDVPASLTDVGRVMGLSRERVRQIEGEALDAVRRKLARDAKKKARR
jgi:RNA polymerase sigma factor (sigma-70 family)